MRSSKPISMLLITFAFVCSSVALAQRARPTRKWQRHRVTATWQGQELAKVFDGLTEATGAPIWIDRRVDRGQKVTVEIRDLTVLQTVEKITERQPLGVVVRNGLIYVGPQAVAERLPAILREARNSVKQAGSRVRKAWLRPGRVSWPKLTEPRALAQDWTREIGATLTGEELIPHDLWAANNLPAMATIDRLAILLAGFDLQCQVSPAG